MNTPFDPWLQAEELARHLKRPGTHLNVVIGAEAWCQKCQNIRPIFDAQVEQAPKNEIWLWLDMEEHAEFIGDYLPPDLPMLVCYENSSIVNLQSLAPDRSALNHALTHPVVDAAQQDPGIRARLLQENWAN